MVLLKETLSSAVKKQPKLLIGTFLDLMPPHELPGTDINIWPVN